MRTIHEALSSAVRRAAWWLRPSMQAFLAVTVLPCVGSCVTDSWPPEPPMCEGAMPLVLAEDLEFVPTTDWPYFPCVAHLDFPSGDAREGGGLTFLEADCALPEGVHSVRFDVEPVMVYQMEESLLPEFCPPASADEPGSSGDERSGDAFSGESE